MDTHDIIVIGGSTGSLDALKRVFADLPNDLPASLFIVTHRAQGYDGLLPEILRDVGPLVVRSAVDGERIERGIAYVAPTGRHLMLNDGCILLGRGPRENMARPAVDPLFRSAAVEYGPRVIGVILSGLLDDGASGLASVRQCGGIAVVQDPADCAASAMPISALQACEVDYRFPASKLAAGLARLVQEPAGAATAVSRALALEVQIAAGRPCTSETLMEMATPMPLSCPSCSGVLSQMADPTRLRFRCQIGHAFTAEALDECHEESVSNAIGVAIRVLEERYTLLTRMAEDASKRGHLISARGFAERASGYREQAETLRKAISGDLP